MYTPSLSKKRVFQNAAAGRPRVGGRSDPTGILMFGEIRAFERGQV